MLGPYRRLRTQETGTIEIHIVILKPNRTAGACLPPKTFASAGLILPAPSPID